MAERERIVCLAGDGIGPEIMREAKRALAALVPDAELDDRLLGATAIRATGNPLPDETLAACQTAAAVLKAPIGDPEFDAAEIRPEQGLLRLRSELDVYANLRPSKDDRVDLLIIRELVGGLYFGERGVLPDGTVYDTCAYHPSQIERVVRRAFRIARGRDNRLTSVDKANVLDTSRLWRRIVDELAVENPGVAVEHLLVDNAAMQLATAPEQFDVIVTENMFGDILSDLVGAVTGGIGLAPSASLSDGGPGIFEPVHGSAPDLAGTGTANPAAMLLSTALLLEHGLNRPAEARVLVDAVRAAIEERPTRDLGGTATTSEFGDAVLARVEEAARSSVR